jgi:hypothetical protein
MVYRVSSIAAQRNERLMPRGNQFDEFLPRNDLPHSAIYPISLAWVVQRGSTRCFPHLNRATYWEDASLCQRHWKTNSLWLLDRHVALEPRLQFVWPLKVLISS